MKRLPLLLLLLVLVACGGPGVDQPSADHFTDLKAYHTNFIDRFTGSAARSYDGAALDAECRRGTEQFDAARTYMESKKDKKRLNALAYLRGEFDKDCAFLRSVEKLLSESYATERKAELGKNYDHAIAAEYSKVGAAR